MSGLFKLNGKDLLKGLVVAIISAVLSLGIKMLDSNGVAISSADLQQVLLTVLTATLSYLSKNLITSEDGKLGGKIQV